MLEISFEVRACLYSPRPINKTSCENNECLLIARGGDDMLNQVLGFMILFRREAKTESAGGS